jgi:hypothetical protein
MVSFFFSLMKKRKGTNREKGLGLIGYRYLFGAANPLILNHAHSTNPYTPYRCYYPRVYRNN